MCSCCPVGVGVTAVDLAASGISIESTQSVIHIYFTLCTGDVPVRDFQTKLGFIPSIFVLDLTLQHYSASMPSWWTIPARCHPKVSLLEGGFDDNHREKRLSRKLVRSIKRWAASVMTARLPAMCPPRGYRTGYGVRAPRCHQIVCVLTTVWWKCLRLTELKMRRGLNLDIIYIFSLFWQVRKLRLRGWVEFEYVEMNCIREAIPGRAKIQRLESGAHLKNIPARLGHKDSKREV